MTEITLSRPGEASVTLRLIGEPGDLTAARDIGKPNLTTHATGTEAPRTQDNRSGVDGWTLPAILLGANAYDDARTLAEEIIIPRLSDPLELDLSNQPERGTYDVAPAGEAACTLTYAPGELDVVGVQLSLAQVNSLNGGTQTEAPQSTPPSGAGVRLSNPTTAASVDFEVEEAVTRTCGRPNIDLNPSSFDLPVAIDQNKPASDVFEIESALITDARATASTLEEDVIRPRLGNGSLTLSFLGETYGLGEYNVVPSGSQALRTAVSAARAGEVSVPTLELQRTM